MIPNFEVRDSLGRICRKGDVVVFMPPITLSMSFEQANYRDSCHRITHSKSYHIGECDELRFRSHGFAQSGPHYTLFLLEKTSTHPEGVSHQIEIDSENGSACPFYRIGGPSDLKWSGIDWIASSVEAFTDSRTTETSQRAQRDVNV